MIRSVRNIARGLPRELNLITIDICALCLRVGTFDTVFICEVPASGSLWLVETEISLKVASVRVEPLSTNKLAVFERSNVLLSCLGENVCSLAVFLSICPVS